MIRSISTQSLTKGAKGSFRAYLKSAAVTQQFKISISTTKFLFFTLQFLFLYSSHCSAQNDMTTPKIQIVNYEEVKDLPNHPEVLLIDVREPDELKETGKIPTSINIPLATVQKELGKDITPEEFKKKYLRDKPSAETEIIFTCRSGRRSQQAAEYAVGLGYKNVKSYKGSWIDWAQREGLPQ